MNRGERCMKKLIKWFIMATLVMCLAGCGSEMVDNTVEDKTTETDDMNDSNVDNADISDESPEVSEKKEKETITIYYVNMDTGEREYETVEVIKREADIIWNELKTKGLLTEQCEINSFELDEENGKIDLDVNKSFGDYLRSMGTAGEEEILGCIVQSYLESYSCDKIKITENGEALETGHTILDDYISRN